MRRNPPITNKLLAHMLALRTAYQYAHWNAKNYADHLLFEKLYTSLDGGIDILAEISQQHVEPVATPSITDRGLMKAEDKIIAFAQDAVENDRPDPGFENFLLGLIEHRERAKYLLAQRSDKAANRDAEARERREAALEGGVYKNPKSKPLSENERRDLVRAFYWAMDTEADGGAVPPSVDPLIEKIGSDALTIAQARRVLAWFYSAAPGDFG